LGQNSTVNSSSPVSAVGGFSDWCAVGAGIYHTVAVRTNGSAWSWGRGGAGRLGNGTDTDRSSPVSVVGGFSNWCAASANGFHSVALRTNGTSWAWGFNSSGQLGDNSVTNSNSPVSVVGGFTNWCGVSAGDRHSLAVRTSGSAWAWGCGGAGRLGNNDSSNRSSPGSVVGGFGDWCQVSAGVYHSVALRQTNFT
jgi:alpha-tubulin suppressor-like RCC1 family protein